MARVALFLLPLALAVYAAVDCAQTPARLVRGLPKLGWLLLILVLWIVGPLLWLVAGRPRRTSPRQAGATSPARWGQPSAVADEPARRQVAPDDDPEFIAQLSRALRRRRDLGGDDPRD